MNEEKKLSCTIVRDLLPNYIEGLTAPETNEMLEEHMATCAPCNGTYNYMRAKTEMMEETLRKDTQGKRFFKKARVRRLLVAFIALALALVLAFLGLYVLKLHREVPMDKIHLDAIYELPEEKLVLAFRVDGMHAGQYWAQWSQGTGIHDLGEMEPGFYISVTENYQFYYSWWEMLFGDRSRGDLYYFILDLDALRSDVLANWLLRIDKILYNNTDTVKNYAQLMEMIKGMMDIQVRLGVGNNGPLVWYDGRGDVVKVTSPDEVNELLRRATIALGGTWFGEVKEMPMEPVNTDPPVPYQTFTPAQKPEAQMAQSTPSPQVSNEPESTPEPVPATK